MIHRVGSILCAVGLCRDSSPVLAQAASLALATGAEVHVLHAVRSLSDDVMNTLRVNIQNPDSLASFMQQRVDQARQELGARLDAFWESQPDEHRAVASRVASVEVVEGYPAAVITRAASQRGCDLIVMAANKHGLTASYAGKVTKGVLKRSHIPVVVVPAPE